MYFVAADCEFVAIGLAFGVFEDVEDLVMFVFCKVAISQKTPGFLSVFLS
jgi:hypothetical protein